VSRRPDGAPSGSDDVGPLLRDNVPGGRDVIGCHFLWSSQDNFEWIYGYGDRFGIIYVNFDTQQRIPKLSAKWFREAAERNEVV
jgi:beta-glucosidase/6-phospho-beta-glucosidase/beta-galactosidase